MHSVRCFGDGPSTLVHRLLLHVNFDILILGHSLHYGVLGESCYADRIRTDQTGNAGMTQSLGYKIVPPDMNVDMSMIEDRAFNA